MFKRQFTYLAEQQGDTGSAGGGAAPAAVDQGQQGQSAAQQSALAVGANQTPAAINDLIPEKYRVTKEDKSFDLEASARKVTEAYKSLETKLGSGQLPPEKIEDYKITPPDAFKEILTPDAPEVQEFLKSAHEQGLTQSQLDFVMGQYYEMLPQLTAGSNFTAEETIGSLKDLWKGEYQGNINASYQAAVGFAEKSGVKYEELEQAGLANNPVFLRIMASVGSEMKEAGSAPASGLPIGMNEHDLEALMKSPAYLNPKDPQHAAVKAKVTAYYNQKYGTAPAS